jgi:hypothetical protein
MPFELTSPGQRAYDLEKARQRLQDARFQGVLTFRDQNGELVTYKTDSEMAAALKALDAEIARLEGRAPASTIHFRTSKGI